MGSNSGNMPSLEKTWRAKVCGKAPLVCNCTILNYSAMCRHCIKRDIMIDFITAHTSAVKYIQSTYTKATAVQLAYILRTSYTGPVRHYHTLCNINYNQNSTATHTCSVLRCLCLSAPGIAQALTGSQRRAPDAMARPDPAQT